MTYQSPLLAKLFMKGREQVLLATPRPAPERVTVLLLTTGGGATAASADAAVNAKMAPETSRTEILSMVGAV
jgi:hypothetical protein